MLERLKQLTELDVYPKSIQSAGGVTYFLARRGTDKWVGAIGDSDAIKIWGQEAAVSDGDTVIVGPLDADNARAIREIFPWAGPTCIDLTTSVGLGDRLGDRDHPGLRERPGHCG